MFRLNTDIDITDDMDEQENTDMNADTQSARNYIRKFEELTKNDVPIAGGKGANLGELTHADAPVPPGFAVTSMTFDKFLKDTGLNSRITNRISKLDVDNTKELRSISQELQSMIMASHLPDDMRRSIAESYKELSEREGKKDPFVAVRSSATAEDTADTSFAGMNETFLNIKGEDKLIDAVKRCWASMYGARVLFYRSKQNVPEEKMSIAAIVQTMVVSE